MVTAQQRFKELSKTLPKATDPSGSSFKFARAQRADALIGIERQLQKEGFDTSKISTFNELTPQERARAQQGSLQEQESARVTQARTQAQRRRTIEKLEQRELERLNQGGQVAKSGEEVRVTIPGGTTTTFTQQGLGETTLNLTRSGQVTSFESRDIETGTITRGRRVLREGKEPELKISREEGPRSSSGTLEPLTIQKQTPVQKILMQAEIAEFRSRRGSFIDKARFTGQAFLLGAASVPVALVTDPIGTVKSTAKGVASFVRNPSQSVFNLGRSIQTNPATTTGQIAGGFATGRLIGKGISQIPSKSQLIKPKIEIASAKVRTITGDDKIISSLTGKFKANVKGKTILGEASGLQTTKGGLSATAIEFAIKQPTGKTTKSRLVAKTRLTQRGDITRGITLKEIAGETGKPKRSLVITKSKEVIGGDFPRFVTKSAGISSRDLGFNTGGASITRGVAEVTQQGRTVFFSDILAKQTTSKEVLKVFPRTKLGRRGQISLTSLGKEKSKFTGPTDPLLGELFVRGIRASLRPDRKLRRPFTPLLFDGARTINTSQFGLSRPSPLISSQTNAFDISFKPAQTIAPRTGITSKPKTAQKPKTTVTSINRLTGGFTPSPRPIPQPKVPPSPKLTLFRPKGSSLTPSFIAPSKSSGKSKRKFRGTPSLPTLFGFRGQQLTKEQIAGKEFINPFAIRQL